MGHLIVAMLIIGGVAIALEELDDWYERRVSTPRKRRTLHKPSQHVPTHQDWGE